MSRIVIRIILGLLFVLVASFSIVRWGAIEASRGDVRHHFVSHVNTVAKAHYRLNNAPPEQLDAELAALQKDPKYSIRLLDPTRDKIPAKVRKAWLKNEPLITWKKHHNATVWLPVRKNARLMVVRRRPVIWNTAPLVWMVLALFSVVLLTGVALSWPLVRRIRKLERIADRISAGELEARADVSSKDAVGRLARRFNAMADQVQLLLGKQNELIQAVSHELRTPAARIRFGLELLQTAETQEDRQRRIAAIDEDLDELDNLVRELMLFIKSGNRTRPLDLEPVPVQTVLSDLVQRQGELRPEIDCSLDKTIVDGVTVNADRKHFRRALRNLLDNALRYAKSRVVVAVQQEAAETLVSVTDDGPGVAAEDRERIFEPFSRVDASRSRESGGVGLGLAIVQRILQEHGGTVQVQTVDGGGARFETRWPADTNGYKAKPKRD